MATALTAALRVSFSRGGHDWRVMSDACMGLVSLYSTIVVKSTDGEDGVGDDGSGSGATPQGEESTVGVDAAGILEVRG